MSTSLKFMTHMHKEEASRVLNVNHFTILNENFSQNIMCLSSLRFLRSSLSISFSLPHNFHSFTSSSLCTSVKELTKLQMLVASALSSVQFFLAQNSFCLNFQVLQVKVNLGLTFNTKCARVLTKCLLKRRLP